MKSPLHIRSTLQPTELGQNHEELAVDVVDWVQHCDTQYGCTDVACREVHLFLDTLAPLQCLKYINKASICIDHLLSLL